MTPPLIQQQQRHDDQANRQMVPEKGLIDSRGFLTVADVARLLRLSLSMVYAMIARGEIPHERFGRSIRIPRQFLAVIEERSARSCEASEWT